MKPVRAAPSSSSNSRSAGRGSRTSHENGMRARPHARGAGGSPAQAQRWRPMVALCIFSLCCAMLFRACCMPWTADSQKPLTPQKSVSVDGGEDDTDSSAMLPSIGIFAQEPSDISYEGSSEHNGANNGTFRLRSISLLFGALRTKAFTRNMSVDASANYCKLQNIFKLQQKPSMVTD